MAQFEARNLYYLRISHSLVLPLVLQLHDPKQFDDVMFQELLGAVREIIYKSIDSHGYFSVSAVSNGAAEETQNIYRGEGFAFTLLWVPTKPRYSVLINKDKDPSFQSPPATKTTTVASASRGATEEVKQNVAKSSSSEDTPVAPAKKTSDPPPKISEPIIVLDDEDEDRPPNAPKKELIEVIEESPSIQQKEESLSLQTPIGHYASFTLTEKTLVVRTLHPHAADISGKTFAISHYFSPDTDKPKAKKTASATAKSSSSAEKSDPKRRKS